MTGYFSDLHDELVARSAELSGPKRRRGPLRSARSRLTAGLLVAVAGAGGVAGLASSAAGPEPVSAVPADVGAAIPALSGARKPVPELVLRAFDNAPDETVNGALARPLIAGLPDGSLSWVAPAADGACLGVPDPEIDAMSVVCATTDEINRRGIAIGTYEGNPESGPGVEVGVGGSPRTPGGNAAPAGSRAAVVEADGSYARRIR